MSRPHFKGGGPLPVARRRRTSVVTAIVVFAVVAVTVLVAASAAFAGITSTPTTLVKPHGDGTALGSAAGAPAASSFVPPALAPWLQAGGRAGAVTIFSDGFETGGSSQWYVQAPSGTPAWAITTYRAATGTHSAYCAGTQIAAPGPYANNMNTWITVGPLDLSSLTSGSFTYKLYGVIQSPDMVFAGVSLDDSKYYGNSYNGAGTAWLNGSIDLTNVPNGLGNVCGKTQVYFAFHFVSDGSGTAEGAYVDDVSIAGTTASSGPKDAGLVLTADATVVPYNGSVNMVGALLDATGGFLVPNKEVGLYWSQENKIDGTWNFAGSATSSTGDYQVSATHIQRLTYFAAFFNGDTEYNSCMSNLVKVLSRALVTPPAVPSVVRAGVRVTSWGSVKPVHTAAQNKASHTKVYLERYSAGKYRPVVTLYAQKYVNTSSETRYSITLQYHSGSWRVRAVHQDDDHAKSVSDWRYFTVR
jgi:hypothetical protein